MRCLLLCLIALSLASNVQAQSIHGRDGASLPAPPAAEPNPVIDNYFGTKITDNYRWLEDAKSTETRNFIDAAKHLHHSLPQTEPHPQPGAGRSRSA